MTRGRLCRNTTELPAQHIQNIRFHVNDVFDAHCANPIGPATSTTTSEAIHLPLGQIDTLQWRAEVHGTLRCGGATRTNQKALHISWATCRGLLDEYRFSKYSRAVAADWAFLVPHLSTLCTLRAGKLV